MKSYFFNNLLNVSEIIWTRNLMSWHAHAPPSSDTLSHRKKHILNRNDQIILCTNYWFWILYIIYYKWDETINHQNTKEKNHWECLILSIQRIHWCQKIDKSVQKNLNTTILRIYMLLFYLLVLFVTENWLGWGLRVL